ncbi:Uncharacterised protein [Streptococcus pneumoniae]|uniref:Uncharacterized protein n=1 Tax=Streptococcus pneumoniae TaxID=1313 RepID=A0A4J1XTY4_STREE|nr:Uncharacterised protein [Streptococcus pneumoniae]CJJ53827.1 Uncharacterised protein [Streptococcus pneumoniae]CMV62254.1 Uncharacterised protein [Streptococcus pneumoniae]COF81245.1 Uncharacterised protein [Streptococcus pneumoniae]CWD79681.1 Uncharacterised protein [Streptococcus pneumoniae]
MSENAIVLFGFKIGLFSGPAALKPLPAVLKPLYPLSTSSLRIAGFWRASERLKPGFKISLVDAGAEVVSTLAAVLVGKTALSTAERSVVAAGLVSSFASTILAFFATGVSDTVPLLELERSSRPIIDD